MADSQRIPRVAGAWPGVRAKTRFFDYLAFALQFAPAGPEEMAAIRAKLARLGVRAGKPFALKHLSPEQEARVALGMKDGDAKIEQYLATGEKIVNGWKIGSSCSSCELVRARPVAESA